MATTAKKTTAAPKPLSQAMQYAQQQQQQQQIRLGVLGALLLLLAFPQVPSPLAGVDWRGQVLPSLTALGMAMPPEPLDLGLFVLPSQPLWCWLYGGVAGFLGLIAFSLVMHVLALYTQRTAPLRQTRSYLRLRIPLSTPASGQDGITLHQSLHSMLPAQRPGQAALPPVVTCWTLRPEQRAQWGVSLALDAVTARSLEKRLQGVMSGTKVVAEADPLAQALTEGRVLAVGTLRLTAADSYPLAMGLKDMTLQRSVLTAMAPQAGVVLSSLRTAQVPLPDRQWRLGVLGLLERQKLDLATDEQQALKTKASGPAFRTQVQLLAVASDAAAAVGQVQTMAGAFAASTQAVGMVSQQLRLAGVQVYPAVVPPPARLPLALRVVGALLGLALGGWAGWYLWARAVAVGALWAVPALLLLLPLLALAAWWRRRTNADLGQRQRAALLGLMPPQNPRLVPLWWPWLGHS
ncbi:hypothetical protein F8S13_22585 [Chloroflexia bacterium SDU3-3]|nr:hypothetical protein F8S13_22585 [Chloroflexia bacterium SDU3-3]